MNRKRSGGMIVERILEVCAHGASKTRIIYQSNLNSITVRHYLEILVDNGLLEIDQGDRTTYKTTNAGFDFMKNLKPHNEEIVKLSSLLLMHACVFFWLASIWIFSYLSNFSTNMVS